MPPKPKSKKTGARAAAIADQATMVVTLYDGTRQSIQDKDFLIRIFDSFQNQLFDKERPAPTTVFKLPFHDNLQDNCIVLASGKGYVDAGFSPVKLSPKAVAMVDLMLLEDNADFKFQTWAALKNSDPMISNFISVGSSDAEAKAHYDNVRQTMPPALASLLNLATAMKAIQLPNKTPLDYFKEILWDESLAQDRFFGYADKSIADQVRRADPIRRGKRPSHVPREGHEENRRSGLHQGRAGHRLLSRLGRSHPARGYPQLHHPRPDRPEEGVCAAQDCRPPRRRSRIRSPIHDCRLERPTRKGV